MHTSPQHDSRLRLLAPLGHGGMSDVWLGSLRGPAGFEKLVAIKQLRFVRSEVYDRGSAFLREARLSALLNHPNVIQTFEILAQGGDYRIVMEFLEGQPLNRILRRFPEELTLPQLVSVIVDALAGLHYAHELADAQGRPLGVVHRDVSPHNIFVTYQGGVKVLDFGIAAVGQGDPTGEHLVKGKIAYMAPEQAAATGVDRRADVFAMGVVLWEILARRPMWSEASPQVYAELIAGELPSIDEAAPGTPAVLRAICVRALAQDREQRFPTAAAMRSALDGWLGQQRPDPLALGGRLAELFAIERERMRTIVAHSLATDDQTDETDLYAPIPAGERPSLELMEPPPAASERGSALWLVPLTGAFGAVVALGVVLLLATAGGLWWFRHELAAWVEGGAPQPVEAPGGCPAEPIEVELSGTIDSDASLSCQRSYRLSGVVRIEPGSTLQISPGVVIRAAPGSAVVVEPGARIVAEGTPEAPIRFTSAAAEPAPGDWGGLVLLGRAPTNLEAPRFKGLTPGGEPFGGDRPDDDSGVLRYVRIAYAGMVLAPNNETNGLSLAGVGRGTVIDHVEVRHGADDCFEWFGGTVDASHLVCIEPGDDGFDVEYGYRGTLSSLVLVDGGSGGRDQHGIEVDNNASDQDAIPRTAPVIEGVTLCALQPHEGYGMLIRRGAEGTYRDVWVDGFAAALDVRDHGGLSVGSLAVSPGTPHAPIEDGPADDPGPRGDDDGGLDEQALIQPGTMNARCSIPPVGRIGGLRPDERWDQGWVRWP